MQHLTYTGPYAGQTLCQTAHNDTDKYAHFTLASDAFISEHVDCPTCRHMGLCKLDTCDICDNATVTETIFTRGS